MRKQTSGRSGRINCKVLEGRYAHVRSRIKLDLARQPLKPGRRVVWASLTLVCPDPPIYVALQSQITFDLCLCHKRKILGRKHRHLPPEPRRQAFCV